MFIIIFLLLVILIFIYDRKRKNYWLEKGVYSSPSPFVLGQLRTLLSGTPFWETIDECYKKGKNFGIIGVYELFNPKLLVTDPNLIKHILVKDFDHFVDRRSTPNSNDKDKISQLMIVNACGERWKAMRSVTTPVFSSGKLKAMFPLIEKEAENVKAFCHLAMLNGTVVNMVELCGKYALNVIQSCAFGMEGDDIGQTPSDLHNLIQSLFKQSYTVYAKIILAVCSPKLFDLLGLSFITPAQTKVHNYMKDVLSQRRQAASPRKDLISYMIEAEKEGKQLKDGTCVVDDDVIISQSALFMLAGYDTVRNNLAFIIHCIAKYPQEQEMLREELRLVVSEEGIDYQSLLELPYLDAFISETMRLYPTAFMIERKCTKDYKIPDSELVIPKDMLVDIPTYSLHYDPIFWDEPKEFRPSRFLKCNKGVVNTYTYLPFGLGPRNCLGNRFALLEMKMVIAKLLLPFHIMLKPGSSLKIDKAIITLRPDSDHGVDVILNRI